LKLKKLNLNSEDLFLLDSFFKKEIKGNYRYGTMGFFYWKILLNKSMKGFVNGIYVNSSLASTTSITPKDLLINNNLIKAAEIGDTYTNSKYRGRGFFSTLVNKSRAQTEKSGIHFIYGLPNSQSLPMHLKMCDMKISPNIKPYSFRYQMDIKKFIKSKAGSIIANILNFIFKFFIRIHHLFLILYNQFLNKYAIKLTENLPNDFDDFWYKAQKEWDFIFTRKSEFLNWRFCLNPEKYFFLIVRKETKIIGYLVYKVIYSNYESKIVIADILFLNKHKSALNLCLEKIRNFSFLHNINFIYTWLDIKSIYIPIIKLNGFLYKKNIFFINYINDFSLSLSSKLKKIHFTISDSDNV